MTVTMKSRFILVCAAALMGAIANAGMPLIWPQLLPFAGPVGYPPGGGTVGVPCQINHQGVVSVNGVRFNGNAKFYFAIVDPDASVSRWTNDGTNIGSATRPTAGVTLPVANGTYSVRLGDNAAPVSMTPIPSGIFADDNLRIRVWFDDMAGHGVQQLAPDQPLAAVPYAMRLPNVMVNDSGNVGVGTTTPGARLDVAGVGEILRVGNPSTTLMSVSDASWPGKLLAQVWGPVQNIPPNAGYQQIATASIPVRAGQTVLICGIVRTVGGPMQINIFLNGAGYGPDAPEDLVAHHSTSLTLGYVSPIDQTLMVDIRLESGGGGTLVESAFLQVISLN